MTDRDGGLCFCEGGLCGVMSHALGVAFCKVCVFARVARAVSEPLAFCKGGLCAYYHT
jgi:hypothetical protein